MKQLKTPEHLKDQLAKEWAWRKKELALLQEAIELADEKDGALKTHLRASHVLLYAHWEGFIKNAAQYYLSFVYSQSLTNLDLQRCFIAIALQDKLNKWEQTISKSAISHEIVGFMFDKLSESAKMPNSEIIKTESNLKAEMLREIVTNIGIDYSPYELEEQDIDRHLVGMRNEIAHGQYTHDDKNIENIRHDKQECLRLYKKIIGLIENFSTQIQQAADEKLYHRQISSIT